jgi:hypothetical protein
VPLRVLGTHHARNTLLGILRPLLARLSLQMLHVEVTIRAVVDLKVIHRRLLPVCRKCRTGLAFLRA